ncbi:conserved Plasmodium protein, unknown function [Plasmodium vinckei vinckei]|uniref:Uncharacterized protein n=1 Tax=Plasmodium vinckei vinckei TaxID=54757 RepID=A0A449BRH2_PLAVN|nr:conserved Plasmodium protein, unknown function [Plasmodium vinckei vinckei]KEG01756.1 hypothetical protein YYE_03275 [Plasmodium vinckei vinckei]VEV55959.1 conserved Plasmodium protein, unknown function [Plasmodium vinckei vinckei]
MDKNNVLEKIEKSGYNSEIFLNQYFDIYVSDNNEPLHLEHAIVKEKIQNLKNYINDEKVKLNNKINEETINFKEKNLYVKKCIDNIIISNIAIHTNVNQINHKAINEKDVSSDDCFERKSPQKTTNLYTNLTDAEYDAANSEQEGNYAQSKQFYSDEAECKVSVKRKENRDETDDEVENDEGNIFAIETNENISEWLKKSIELKGTLDKIKKCLLFLKCYPTIEKNIKELLLLGGNSNLDTDEKIKNVLKIYENLIYINEHEEIIKDLKNNYSFEKFYSIYSNKFFDDFYLLLNDIIFAYMINNVNINIYEIVNIYIYLLDIYFNYMDIKEYDYEYQINQINKKLILYLTENYFSKTFLKFVQSEQNLLIYNIMIIYYEYFTSFIEEKKESMINILHIFMDKLEEVSNKKKSVIDKVISKIEKQMTDSQCSKTDSHFMLSLQKDNHSQMGDPRQAYIDKYFVNLFKESVNVVCTYIENSKMLKNFDNDTKKNMVFKIIDSLNTSINILTNMPLFINKKYILQKILKESIFINKDIINEYIINVTNISKFYNDSFENINLKVHTFDRHNLLLQNKLLIFFTDLQNDIKNIIDNKKDEINNNTIFHSQFFRFLIFFSYIHYIDTEFLLLFINIYNFLYEIIYNIKEEIKSKETQNRQRGKHTNEHNIFGRDNQSYNIDHAKNNNNNINNEIEKENSQIIIDESLQTQEYLNTSNMVIDYIKNIISIFFNLLNIFDIIFRDYIKLSSYIFERTYYYFNNNSYTNILCKFYISREKTYPPEIYANVAHLHNFFFHGDFSKKNKNNTNNSHNIVEETISINDEDELAKESNVSIQNEYPSSSNIDEADKLSESVTEKGEKNTNKKIRKKNDEPNYNSSTIFDDSELEEYGKYLLKSSISKLKEIKNTIEKNVIQFSLIPLYAHLNKYIEKIRYIKQDANIKFYDPHENICLLVETIFAFIEIYYENKNTNLLQELFLHLSEKYFSLINTIQIVNKNIILQIQADVNYLINVCTKFKIQNYKFLFLLNQFLSFYFVITANNEIGTIDVHTSFQSYANENIEKETNISFDITSDDISRTATNMMHIFKDQ